jgi:hypothetical protein
VWRWGLQVLEQIAERTKDFINANAGVELTRKIGTGANLSPAELALIVKQIPVRHLILSLTHSLDVAEGEGVASIGGMRG